MNENIVADYIMTLPRDGKPTLLIDEIDGVLDFDNLYKFWKVSINELVKKFQIMKNVCNEALMVAQKENIVFPSEFNA